MGQKIHKTNFKVDSIKNQKGKVFFVTGANSGLGLETCKVLASKGATVVMTFRNAKKAEKAIADVKAIAADHEGRVETLQLDLADLSTVKKAAEEFKELGLPLHCLINNAGVMMTPKQQTKDGFEMQFGTNHLGHFALTALLFPIIEETASADSVTAEDPVRIVNLSSYYHYLGPKEGILFDNLNWDDKKEPKYTRELAYGHSKFANLVFTKCLKDRMSKFNGKMVTFAVHPGVVDTGLFEHKKKQRSKVLVNAYLKLNNVMKPQRAVLTQLYCSVSPEPVKQEQSGEYFVPLATRSDLGKGCPKITDEMKAKFWDVSEELTQTKFLSE